MLLTPVHFHLVKHVQDDCKSRLGGLYIELQIISTPSSDLPCKADKYPCCSAIAIPDLP